VKIYIDATFDKHTHVAFIGYCNPLLTITNVKKIKASDINQAEMSALCLAVRNLGVDNEFLTDSMSVVNQCECENVSHVSRSMNIADSVVAISKESNLNNIRNKL